MALKTFKVLWAGIEEDVEFEDDIPFGEMEKIIKDCVDVSEVTRPKVNISEYRRRILMSTLTKAPFNHKDPVAVHKLPRKTAEKIIGEVMKEYPLANSLEGWMMSFLGSMELADLPLTPTLSVPPSSDGQNPK